MVLMTTMMTVRTFMVLMTAMIMAVFQATAAVVPLVSGQFYRGQKKDKEVIRDPCEVTVAFVKSCFVRVEFCFLIIVTRFLALNQPTYLTGNYTSSRLHCN